ncbi:hypothetical protein CLIM01_13678 [Colletotrichum limetticola]|uniref:Uncharacterized protein n=1 Tax=Colletotrichum limetticola TaxID=1209924 RepID=A0ABQ9PAC3_9PEZI|nr:hypothetical protein CLIM01_13678 [Colletotrichum limetticola]
MPNSAGLGPETVAQDDGQKPSQPLAEWYEIQPDDPDSDYDDECAIYDDDSADKSSVSEETSNSRYSLIILLFKKKTRDRGMGNVVPHSTPALPWNLPSQHAPPILDVSSNDFDDAPLIMSRGKSSVPLKSITEAPPCSAI